MAIKSDRGKQLHKHTWRWSPHRNGYVCKCGVTEFRHEDGTRSWSLTLK